MGRIRFLLADLTITLLAPQDVHVEWSYPFPLTEMWLLWWHSMWGIICSFQSYCWLFPTATSCPILAQKKGKKMFPNRFILIFQVLDSVSFSRYMKKKVVVSFLCSCRKKVQQSFTPAGNFSTCLSGKKSLSPLLWGEFNKPVKPLTTQVGGRSQQGGI